MTNNYYKILTTIEDTLYDILKNDYNADYNARAIKFGCYDKEDANIKELRECIRFHDLVREVRSKIDDLKGKINDITITVRGEDARVEYDDNTFTSETLRYYKNTTDQVTQFINKNRRLIQILYAYDTLSEYLQKNITVLV